MATLSFSNIGLNGKNVGTLSLTSEKLRWSDSKGNAIDIDPLTVATSSWTQFGSSRGHWRVYSNQENGSFQRFDGLSTSDFQKLESFLKENYKFRVNVEEVS